MSLVIQLSECTLTRIPHQAGDDQLQELTEPQRNLEVVPHDFEVSSGSQSVHKSRMRSFTSEVVGSLVRESTLGAWGFENPCVSGSIPPIETQNANYHRMNQIKADMALWDVDIESYLSTILTTRCEWYLEPVRNFVCEA